MKLAPILAKYLFLRKKLDLPGIGTFRVNTYIPEEPVFNKQGKAIVSETISFEQQVAEPDISDLVLFISQESGRIKPLAAADLDSHIEMILQFLNIGKPFMLEGIGILVKSTSGELLFTAGESLPDTITDYTLKEISSTSIAEETFTDYRKPINEEGQYNRWKKPLMALLILGGLAVAIWGGYTVYLMNTPQQEKQPASKQEPQPDSQINAEEQSVQEAADTSVKQDVLPKTYKFIIEIAGAERAFDRYLRLKSYEWPIQIETKDSISYKLFMELPATPGDTSRMVDSLTLLNGRSVFIER